MDGLSYTTIIEFAEPLAGRRGSALVVRHLHTFMTYDVFFAGVGGTLLGTLVGVLISCRLTYGFQKRLLEQQIAFQKQQADLDAAQRNQIHNEMLSVFSEFRNMLNTRGGQIVSRLSILPPQT